ncbi:MAG: hypothetical protein NUV86_08110 [Candidatus Scalindua sp.]|nr:hypothetical protein [Candidatus Scalindua sp.]
MNLTELLIAKNSLKGSGILFTGITVGSIISWYITHKVNLAKIRQLSTAAQKNLVEIEQISEKSNDELNKSFETLSICLRDYRDAQEKNQFKLMDGLREECLNYLNTEVIHSFGKLCSYKRHLCGNKNENKDIFENDILPVLKTIVNVTIELNNDQLREKFDRSPYLISKSNLII